MKTILDFLVDKACYWYKQLRGFWLYYQATALEPLLSPVDLDDCKTLSYETFGDWMHQVWRTLDGFTSFTRADRSRSIYGVAETLAPYIVMAICVILLLYFASQVFRASHARHYAKVHQCESSPVARSIRHALDNKWMLDEVRQLHRQGATSQPSRLLPLGAEAGKPSCAGHGLCTDTQLAMPHGKTGHQRNIDSNSRMQEGVGDCYKAARIHRASHHFASLQPYNALKDFDLWQKSREFRVRSRNVLDQQRLAEDRVQHEFAPSIVVSVSNNTPLQQNVSKAGEPQPHHNEEVMQSNCKRKTAMDVSAEGRYVQQDNEVQLTSLPMATPCSIETESPLAASTPTNDIVQYQNELVAAQQQQVICEVIPTLGSISLLRDAAVQVTGNAYELKEAIEYFSRYLAKPTPARDSVSWIRNMNILKQYSAVLNSACMSTTTINTLSTVPSTVTVGQAEDAPKDTQGLYYYRLQGDGMNSDDDCEHTLYDESMYWCCPGDGDARHSSAAIPDDWDRELSVGEQAWADLDVKVAWFKRFEDDTPISKM